MQCKIAVSKALLWIRICMDSHRERGSGSDPGARKLPTNIKISCSEVLDVLFLVMKA
jgi:hypothetical protein